MDNKIIFKLLNSEGLRFPMILPLIILPKFSSQFIDLLCSRSVILVSCILCLSWFSPDAQSSVGFERYEIILTRSPFGKEPPEEMTAPVRPSGEFAKQYRLSMLYEDAQGQLKAGLVSKVNNKSLLLQVGESGEGVRLVDVLLEEGAVLLSSGDQMARLLLEGLPSSGPIQLAAAGGISVSAAGNPSTDSRQQIFRRQGSAETPEHILTGLTDAAPKRAVIARAKPVFRGAAASSGEPSPAKNLHGEDSRSERVSSGSGDQRQVEGAKKGGNYSVQSVPLYIEKKMLARGL